MSLIVAGYENGNLVIVSDTKLTYPVYMQHSLKNHVNSGNIEYGILKLTIVSEKVCIAFAGDIDSAENAIKEISPNYSLDNILQILLRHHHNSEKRTDFIICVNFIMPIIIVIKDGKYEGVNQGWIGDKSAFERFQKSKVGNNQSITSAFDDVINDETIKTVGGFKVVVYVNSGRFTFGNYMILNREPMTVTLTPNEPFIIGHGSAENGAYTLTFIGSSSDFRHVAFHIKQGNLGILYSRKENGLLRPEIKPRMDEVDFHDYIRTLGIFPVALTQNRYHKFFSDALNAYKSRDFLKAIELFDKATNESNGAEKCEAMFYKGICFHYTRNPKALEVFKDIIKINPSYQNKIQNFFNTQIGGLRKYV